jgi:hypothetical protein
MREMGGRLAMRAMSGAVEVDRVVEVGCQLQPVSNQKAH